MKCLTVLAILLAGTMFFCYALTTKTSPTTADYPSWYYWDPLSQSIAYVPIVFFIHLILILIAFRMWQTVKNLKIPKD